MRGGKLRYPVDVVREITKQTDTGAESVEYFGVLSTRAGINTVTGREYIEGGAETMETTVKIIMRKHADVDKRVLMGDIIQATKRKYVVISVLNFDNDRSLQLMCKEIL